MTKLFKILLILCSALLLMGSCQTPAEEKWDNLEAMTKALEWQEDHPICAKSPRDWTNGAYYTGVYRAHDATQSPCYMEALEEMARENEWRPYERYFHADDLVICTPYLYLKSEGVANADILPAAQIINQHIYKSHRWKRGEDDTMQRILWWWCDALFMAPPLLVTYADEVNDDTYLDEMHKYYMQTYQLLFDEEEDLFARDLRYVCDGEPDIKEPNGEKVFWSRGNGWVLGGLALILEEMPTDYEHYGFYKELYTTMASRIVELQPEDGLWRTSLLNPEGYTHGEVSGSGFYTFALAWGVNNGLLNTKEYTPAIQKAWKALRSCQQKNGMIGWVQNIGDAPKPATADSWQNYGTGAFLLAGSEVIKLNKTK